MRLPALSLLGTSLLSATLLAAIAAPTAAAPSASAEPLRWSDCANAGLRDAGMECATLVVPELRTKPAGATVRLALVRHRSTGTAEQRIGSMLFNPGGPGGSGLDAIAGIWGVLPEEVQQRFDLVSWDPRGVGATTPSMRPADCATPRPVRPLTGPVDWARVVRDFERDLAKANRACLQAYDGDPRGVSTMQNVTDLEAIRAALGEEQLTYWGLSYGTRIGYVYALRYPTRVRAMVLDGPIDPTTGYLGLTEGSAAPDQAYGSFAAAQPQAVRQHNELLTYLNKRTFALPGGVRLDRWTVIDGVYENIAQQASYPVLAELIGIWHKAVLGNAAEQTENAEKAARMVTSINDMPNTAAGGVFSVTNCMDYADRPSTERVVAAVRQQQRLAPRFGATLATMYGVGCAGIDVRPDPVPRIRSTGSNLPVLILGSSRDAATIVQWTARMSRAFPNSRTVTYSGGQHVTWGLAKSTCVDAVATAYVIDRKLPAMDVGCSNTVTPNV